MSYRRTITIPSCVEHWGQYAITVTVPWVCIHCGAPRGEPSVGRSYDGSLWMNASVWGNPCGHIEKYSEVRSWLARQTEPEAA